MNIGSTNPLYNSIINGTNNLLSTQQKISIVRSQANEQLSKNNEPEPKKEKESVEKAEVSSLEKIQNKQLERYIQAAKIGNKNLLAVI